MAYKYFPHTDEEMRDMLKVAGVKSLDDLYSDVPQDLQLQGDYELPESMSEMEVRRHFDDLAAANMATRCFLGAGCYDHYSPSVVQNIVSRSEFLTSYTPYQAEISQGTLQYIFEYQSMMAELTGMEVSNASMYDGCTATAEAMMMAVANAKKRNRVLVSDTLNPNVIRVVETYAKFHGIQVDHIAAKDGVTDREMLAAELAKDDVAGVIVATPNFYGILEDYTGVADMCHEHKALRHHELCCYRIERYQDARRVGRRHRRGRWSKSGYSHELWWSVRRILVHEQEVDSQNARSHRWRYQGYGRQAHLCAHAASPRAAHPPRKGDEQHLLKREPDGIVCDSVYVTDGPEGTARGERD